MVQFSRAGSVGSDGLAELPDVLERNLGVRPKTKGNFDLIVCAKGASMSYWRLLCRSRLVSVSPLYLNFVFHLLLKCGECALTIARDGGSPERASRFFCYRVFTEALPG